MASALMAGKLKCGSTFSSITPISLARLPDLISLSLVIRSTTSSVTVFTSASGASCANAGATNPQNRMNAATILFIGLLQFFARCIAIVDQAAAPLQKGVALEHVAVERRLLEDAARVEQVGARVDEVQAVQGVAQLDRPHFAERREVVIEAGADAVAHRARAEKRQHQVGPGRRAPAAEGLAEIFVVLFQSPFRGHVVDAEQAER